LTKNQTKNKNKKSNTKKFQKLGTAVPTKSQKNKIIIILHSNNTTSFILQLLSLNLQTSITLCNLHQITLFLNQINFKLHPKPTPPIKKKNNNHPSKPINHKIRVTPNPNPKTPISSSILTTTLIFLT